MIGLKVLATIRFTQIFLSKTYRWLLFVGLILDCSKLLGIYLRGSGLFDPPCATVLAMTLSDQDLHNPGILKSLDWRINLFVFKFKERDLVRFPNYNSTCCEASLVDACSRGDFEAVSAALREGASPRCAGRHGRSPLHLAVPWRWFSQDGVYFPVVSMVIA